MRRLGRRGFTLGVTAMVLTSCGWKGVANLPLPIGPGSEKGSETFYVQIPDTLALNTNSRVRVADVFVEAGSIDSALDDYVGTVNVGPLKAASDM